MAAVSPLECGVCNENFDEDKRCPRILPCFHHFCTACIKHLIESNLKSCPFCRHAFVAQHPRDVNINIGVLDLVTFISKKERGNDPGSQENIATDSIGVGSVHSTENSSNILLQACRDIESLIDISIEEVDELIATAKNQNETISSIIIKHFSDIMTKNDKIADDLVIMGKKIREQQNLLNEKEDAVKTQKERLRTSDGKFTDDEDIRKNVEEINGKVRDWIQSLRKSLGEDSKKRSTMTEDVIEATTITEAVKRKLLNKDSDDEDSRSEESAAQALGLYAPSAPPTSVHHAAGPQMAFPAHAQKIGFDECIKPISNLSCSDACSSIGGSSTNPMPVSFLKHMDVSMERLISSGLLMAVQYGECGTRYSNISIEGNKLHLHSLQVGAPTPGATLIAHEDAMSLTRGNSRAWVVFLDLAIDGSRSLGKIYIKLTYSGLEGSQNFKILCTGETGPSYASTTLLGVQARGSDKEAIMGGDYEFNSGRGGKTLVKGLNLGDRKYKSFWKAGTVRGVSFKHFGQFYMNTRDCPDTTCQGTIGNVIAGLNILKVIASQYHKPGKVVVVDSGIVLPCPYLERKAHVRRY